MLMDETVEGCLSKPMLGRAAVEEPRACYGWVLVRDVVEGEE